MRFTYLCAQLVKKWVKSLNLFDHKKIYNPLKLEGQAVTDVCLVILFSVGIETAVSQNQTCYQSKWPLDKQI